MKKPTKKTSYHHGNLAETLIIAGREILQENGTNGLSLRAVAARVGVSQTAPYSHFASKKELLYAISASGFAQLADNMIASVTGKASPWEKFINYGVAYIEFAINNPDIYRLMFATKSHKEIDHKTMPQKDKLSEQASRAYMMLFSIHEAQSKDIDQATIRSHASWGMVHGLASLIIGGLIKVPTIEGRQYLKDLLSNQIRFPH